MATPNAIRGAQRASNIVALLEHKPGPGIYSRLERAVQGLPENVRVQELPGLLKRYKEGIPGWELKAVDFDSVVAGRDVVPRDELLAAVRERSPVFTHRETVLTDLPPRKARQTKPSQIGRGIRHGDPHFTEVSPGVEDHKEIIISEPENWRSVPNPDGSYRIEGFRRPFNNHWDAPGIPGGPMAVAHARAGRSGDALRIQEIQSDIANHNMKAGPDEQIDFALKDSYRELLVKRLLLEAAEKGHRAIEVADPEVISEVVGMSPETARHLYGKVIPGEIERLGRKLGGLTEEPVSAAPTRSLPYTQTLADARRALSEASENRHDVIQRAIMGGMPKSHFDIQGKRIPMPAINFQHYLGNPDNFDSPLLADFIANGLTHDMRRLGFSEEFAKSHVAKSMPEVLEALKAESRAGRATASLAGSQQAAAGDVVESVPPGKRYVLSDEMRKNIITKGIPAAVAIGAGTGIATGGNDAEARPIEGFVSTRFGLKKPGMDEAQLIRSLVKPAERKRFESLTQQLDEAYAKQDFSRVDDLEMQREQFLEDLDSRVSQAVAETEGDYADWEPNDYEGAANNYEEQMRDVYGEYLAGRGGLETEADLANALRGIGPDTQKANLISDSEIIQEAKGAFDRRQAQLASVRGKGAEDGIRSMQAQMRDLPAAVLPVPIMAQAQSVNERRELPTGSGGSWEDIRRGIVGEADFDMAISPAEWEAHKQRQQAEGPSEDQQQFRRNVVDVMSQPIIRVGAARDGEIAGGQFDLLIGGDDYDRITPAKFVGEYLDTFARKMPPEQRAQVMDAVVARLSGDQSEPNQIADAITDRMLSSLKESSPGGKYAKSDPMPQEQFEELKKQHGDWAESMLTPGTAENFQSLRGYELLRATRDGQHAPAYADSMSNAAAAIGGLVDPATLKDFEDATFFAGPEGRFRRANRDYQRSAQQPDQPPAYRDPDGRSRYSSTAVNNITGMLRAGGDTSSTIGAVSWPLHDAFANFSRTNLGQALNGQVTDSTDWQFLQDQHQAFDREQPILPAGMSREMFDWHQAGHKKDREQGLAWGATTFPNVQQAFDNITGSKTKKTWGPPVYNDYGPNFLQNTVGNIPSAALMGASVATGGLTGLAAGAFKPAGSTVRTLVNAGMGLGRGTAKGVGGAVASQAKDLPFDFGTDQAIGGTLGGGLPNYIGYITTPESDNALLPGVDPDAMTIEQLNTARSNALKERDDRYQERKFDWYKQRKTPQEQAYDQWRQAQ